MCFLRLAFFVLLLARASDAAAGSGLSAEQASSIDAEYAYRQQIEAEAPKWARDLMYIYKSSYLSPETELSLKNPRLQSELAWMVIGGHGVLATYDFSHAEQTLLGSTSRLILGLKRSKNFWLEVRKECVEIERLKVKSETKPLPSGSLRACADRLERDLNISQIAGSNISLFVTGGVILKVGQKLYRKYASEWLSRRVLPLIPSFARSKWALGGLVGAVIVVPAAFVVAGISEDQKNFEAFYVDLEGSLKASDESLKAETVLRSQSLQVQREVLELTIWIRERAPKQDARGAEQFLFDLKFQGPHYSKLQSISGELTDRKNALEKELLSNPDIEAKLQSLAQAKKSGAKLSPEDAELYRKAQYLASLRIVLKVL